MSGTLRNDTTILMQQAQDTFLLQGGLFAAPLARMRASGLLEPAGTYHEYPKMLYIKTGEFEDVQCFTEDVKGKQVTWTEKRETIHSTIVNSEEEEERVLNGGKTAPQIEEERLTLLAQAKGRGVRVDPSWSLLRLQREMGVPTAETAPGHGAVFDEIENLKDQVRRAEEALALRQKLKELQEMLNAPAEEPAPMHGETVEISALRRELNDAGVKVDGRWSLQRLREEVERVTSP